jgi:hypothetical protein
VAHHARRGAGRLVIMLLCMLPCLFWFAFITPDTPTWVMVIAFVAAFPYWLLIGVVVERYR